MDDGFKGDMKLMKKGFWVEDFDSNKYIVPEEYLSALGQNKKLQPLIDESSELVCGRGSPEWVVCSVDFILWFAPPPAPKKDSTTKKP